MTSQTEMNEMFVNVLEDISQLCGRLLTGNISYNISIIRCKCKDMLDFYKKYPVSPWHKVADGDLPKEHGDYICHDGYGTRIGWFNTSDKRFYDSYSRLDEEIELKYWMEVPNLPSE